MAQTLVYRIPQSKPSTLVFVYLLTCLLGNKVAPQYQPLRNIAQFSSAPMGCCVMLQS